jgi:DNA repair exonuclease SbcCD ATPase subunit
MIINEITIKNFKSFGNKVQKISFDNDGKLILLYGRNGSGKSTILEVIDFLLYGIVRGKERKKVSLKSLPNRINKNLQTGIKLFNENNEHIEIERYLEPGKIVVKKDNIDYTDIYKKYEQDERETFIGFSYDIYKSFISLNMNDFINFINIDSNTKKKLLDKLFNIEEINDYHTITKDIIRFNNDIIYDLRNKINNNIGVLEKYKKNISDKDIQKYESIDNIKELLNSKKRDYSDIGSVIKYLNEDIKKTNIIINEKEKEKDDIKSEVLKLKVSIKHFTENINIFNEGKCPICLTILSQEKHHEHKEQLLKERQGIKDLIKKHRKRYVSIEGDILFYRDEQKKLFGEKKGLIDKISMVKKDIEILRDDYKEFKKSSYKSNIIDEIKNIEEENIVLNQKLNDITIENDRYNILLKLFSDDGIKRSIIKNIVIPINENLKKYLRKLESNFFVELDDEFNAIIYERKINIIPVESLSVGEMRKINIAIAMSYMESIFRMKKCNILFIDEVFSSIDEINVHVLLQVFKEFALEHKMNIIIINHSFMDHKMFDRIIKVEKDRYFSTIS